MSTPRTGTVSPGLGGGAGIEPIDVVVVGEASSIDHAVVALIEKCGYRAQIVEPSSIVAAQPRVVVLRDEMQLVKVLRELGTHRPVLVGMESRTGAPRTARGRTVVWLKGATAFTELSLVLRRVLGAPAQCDGQVHVTHRELEVLRTYLLGATSKATARRHFIGESTVKTHFQRVTQRYSDAGRPVANKSQLLMQMMADGWIDPGDAVGVA